MRGQMTPGHAVVGPGARCRARASALSPPSEPSGLHRLAPPGSSQAREQLGRKASERSLGVLRSQA